MIKLEKILSEYDGNFHKFEKGLLKEYLQYQILDVIYSSPISKKLIFLGGTSLRIVYNIDRLSEDLDFDNKDLSVDDFKNLSFHIKTQFEKRGYELEIRVVNKGAFHCYIKFPKILHKEGLSPMENEKILIQLDTFDQGVEYKPDLFILNKFDIFRQIQVAPKSIILSQKLWTITQRNRLKGRDFYDILFLLKDTKPDLSFLEQKFETSDLEKIKKAILDDLVDADFNKLSKDVAPFLLTNNAEPIKLFREFLEQVDLE